MQWSVILVSRNGADTLPATLAALAAVTPPAGGMEIIVVDNASTDETPRLLGEFAAAHGGPALKEPRPGKSFALNAAIAAARGANLAFIDDDILPARHWLEAFAAAAARPGAGLLAGQIRPHWLSPPPAWLEALAESGRACGCTDPQAAAGAARAQDVKGGNFAVRRAALGEIRFDVSGSNFGMAGAAAGGEDTRLALDIAAAGHVIAYVPDAIAQHQISAEEMQLGAFISRSARIARGAAAAKEAAHPAGPVQRWGSAAYSAAKAASFAIGASLLVAAGQSRHAGPLLLSCAKNYGRVSFALQRDTAG